MYAVIKAHLCQLVIVCQEILELKHKYTTMTFELFLMGKSNVRGIRQHTNVHTVERGWVGVWLDYINNLWWSDSRIWAMGRRKRRWKENREREKGLGINRIWTMALRLISQGGGGWGAIFDLDRWCRWACMVTEMWEEHTQNGKTLIFSPLKSRVRSFYFCFNCDRMIE